MLIYTIAEPNAEPISLAQAKEWLRLDASDEDDAILQLIRAARKLVEQFSRTVVARTAMRCVLDQWPSFKNDEMFIALPLTPVDQVTEIRVRDAEGVAQPIPKTAYALLEPCEAPLLKWSAPPPAPGVATRGVEIDVVAGYANDAPPEIRQAILVAIAYLYERRGDVRSEDVALNARLREILGGRRRVRLV
jgi:uncharacterized phiE125 gp8 family phage protein